MDACQRFLFDTDGVFVLPGVLTASQLARANTALDAREEALAAAGVGGNGGLHASEVGDTGLDGAEAGPFGPGRAGTSTNSTHDPDVNPLHWDSVFRELLDVPSVASVLEELCGAPAEVGRISTAGEALEGMPTYRLDHINVHTHVKQGFRGGYMHGGGHFGHVRPASLRARAALRAAAAV